MESPILVAQLGSGGMAEVFLAIRRGMGGFVKLVVVKRLRTSALEGDAVAMFHDEARISARLNHPNVVQTHEVGFDGENYRLEMEYLDGQPLHRITHRAKRSGKGITQAMAVAVVQDVLSGLHYAHELRDYDGTPLGIVHRDVSPQNIFVTYDGRVKLVDFGIAKASGQMAVTQLGMVKGKIRYMAPEQATGQPVDARTDVFATGIVLWQLLTGTGYWGDADELAIFARLTNGDLPPGPRSQNPDVPEALDAACSKALAPHPRDRYATAEEFIQALDACGFSERGAQAKLGALAAELFAEVREKIRVDIEKAAARPAKDAATDAPVTPRSTAVAAAPSDDEVTRLGPSERPVSGAVRVPQKRSPWSTALAVGAALVVGAGIAVATMSAVKTPTAASQLEELPRPLVAVPTPQVEPTPVGPTSSADGPPKTPEVKPEPPPIVLPPVGKNKVATKADAGASKGDGTHPEAAKTPDASAARTTQEAIGQELKKDPWGTGP